jgi:GNAT superfamily N-acetyltransferase
MLKIISTSDKQLTPLEISQAHEIMRIAYEMTEVEIWGENYVRLFLKEFTKLVEEGHIFVAYLNDVIVGSIHIYQKDSKTYTFSLLSADLNLGGQGIGSALINRAEEEAIKNNASQIKIEILRVKGIDVPHKIRLHTYYERLGYKYTHSADSNCIIPDWKYKLLVKPSDFDFYTKKLN